MWLQGVACDTNVLHVWIQFHGALRARNVHITVYDVTTWSWVNLVNHYEQGRRESRGAQGKSFHSRSAQKFSIQFAKHAWPQINSIWLLLKWKRLRPDMFTEVMDLNTLVGIP